MELILLLIGVAVVLISAAAVFFVSFRAIKESSFEEVAAERSRRERAIEEELGIRGGGGKDAKKDKKKKKEKKTSKPTDEVDGTAGSSDDLEEPESSKPNVIESSQKASKAKKPKSVDSGNESSGKNPEKKPGKTGGEKKDGKPSASAKETAAQRSKAQQSAKVKKDQDDIPTSAEADLPFIVAESKHRKKKLAASPEASASSRTVARENIATVVSPKVDSPGRVEVKSASNQKTNLPTVSQTVTKNVPTIQSPQISVAGSNSEWTTKTQKKQVAEKVEDSTSQQTISKANEEARKEIALVRQSLADLQKSSGSELAEKAKEVEALKIRLNHAHGEHVAQMNQLTQQLRSPKGQAAAAGGDGQMQLIKILTDENRKLKEEVAATKNRAAPATVQPSGTGDLQQKVQFMDDALKQNAMLLNTSENARKTLDQKLKQTEERSKKIEAQLKDFETKAKESGELLKKSETRSKTLAEELEIAKKDAASFKEELSKFKSEEQRTVELEEKTKSIESQFKVLELLIKDKDIELETLRRTANQLTGDLKRADEAKSKALIGLEEEKKRNNEGNKQDEEQLKSQLQRLQEDLKTSESNKGDLESQIIESKQQQNKLETELAHHKAILADTEKSLTAIQSSVESEEKKWHQRLATVEDQLRVSREEIAKLTDELAKVKNNPENIENGTPTTGDDVHKGESNVNHVEESSDKTVTSS